MANTALYWTDSILFRKELLQLVHIECHCSQGEVKKSICTLWVKKPSEYITKFVKKYYCFICDFNMLIDVLKTIVDVSDGGHGLQNFGRKLTEEILFSRLTRNKIIPEPICLDQG